MKSQILRKSIILLKKDLIELLWNCIIIAGLFVLSSIITYSPSDSKFYTHNRKILILKI